MQLTRLLQPLLFSFFLAAVASAQVTWPPTNTLGPADGLGRSIAILEDVDGDGFDDLLVGEPKTQGTTGVPRVVLFSGPSGQPIHSINGSVGTTFGALVAGVGDVDADGVPDFAVRQDDLDFNIAPVQSVVRIYSGATGAVIRQHGGSEFLYAVIRDLDDIDGDGHDDYVIARDRGAGRLGVVEIYSGASGGVLRSFVASALDEGYGTSIEVIDDLDSDGFPDLAIGRPSTGSSVFVASGAVDLVSSASGAILRTLTDPNGAASRFGDGFAAIGDLDGDGVDDLLVSATGLVGVLPFGAGRVFAMSSATGAVIYEFSPDFGASGAGFAMTSGDFDLDGADDIVFSNPYRGSGNGRLYIYSGANGQQLSIIDGDSAGGQFGFDLVAGDLNGDGIADLCITEARSGGGFMSLGGVVSIHSSPAPLVPAGSETVSSLVLGGSTGVAPLSHHGESLTSLGDADGDGIADFAVSSPGLSNPVGSTTVVGRVDIYSGANQSILTTISGSVESFGHQVTDAGDVDGDGLADVAFTVIPPITNTLPTQPVSIRVHSGATGSQIYSLNAPVGRKVAYMVGAANLDGVGGDDLLYIGFDSNPYASPLVALSSSGVELWSLNLPLGSFFGYGLNVVPDENGDGIDDIMATVFPTGVHGELVTLSGANGAPISSVPLGWTISTSFYHPIVEMGDVDGDGHGDFALGAEAVLIGGPSRLDVVSGATGALIYRVIDPLGASGFGRYVETIGDLSGDGVTELAVSSLSHVTVLDGANGNVGVIHALPANLPWIPRVGGFARIPDMNGDGREELAVGFSDRQATVGQAVGAVDYLSFSPIVANPVQGGGAVPGADLIAEARGTVGLGEGGPYAVLAVNESAGGAPRVVEVGIGESIEFRLKQSPARTAAPQNFALFGLVGTPSPADAIPIPTVGTLLFPPSPAMPGAPWLFTLAETYLSPSIGFLPAQAGDWSFLIPAGLPFATEFTLQGICDDTAPGDTAVTNALVVRVQ